MAGLADDGFEEARKTGSSCNHIFGGIPGVGGGFMVPKKDSTKCETNSWSNALALDGWGPGSRGVEQHAPLLEEELGTACTKNVPVRAPGQGNPIRTQARHCGRDSSHCGMSVTIYPGTVLVKVVAP